MREVRSTFSKSWESSLAGVVEGASFAKGMGKVRMTSCPTQLEWFGDFLQGAEYCIGYETRSNKAVPISVIVKVLDMIQEDASEAVNTNAHQLIKVGAFITILTAGSLQGYEGFFLYLGGIRKHLEKGKHGVFPENPNKMLLSEQEAARLPHVTLCLLGDFRGKSGTNYHMMALANVSQLGIKTRWWIQELTRVAEAEGRLSGPAFASAIDDLDSSMDYDATFRLYLRQVQSEHPHLLLPEEDMTSMLPMVLVGLCTRQWRTEHNKLVLQTMFKMQ